MAPRGDITRLPEIWDVLKRLAPRDTWVPIDEMYRLVEENVRLRRSDFDRAAPESRQQKWKRNVRNVLQARKTPGKTKSAQILWDPPTRSYLVPSSPTLLPPAALTTTEEDYVPEGLPGLDPDLAVEALADSLVDARRRELRAIVIRRGGAAFRSELIAAYDGCCAITTTNGPPALEAAHIVPYRGHHTNHVGNGLLLRGDVHTLFDLGLVAVNPFTMRIEVASELQGTDYASLEKRELSTPAAVESQPSQRSLLYHYARSKVKA